MQASRSSRLAWNEVERRRPNVPASHTPRSHLSTPIVRKLEEQFIPESLQRDYNKTFGHKKH